jgi:hypothetical protein
MTCCFRYHRRWLLKRSMTRGAAGGREAGIEVLKEYEGGDGDGLMEFGSMEGICNKKGEFGLYLLPRAGQVWSRQE